MSYLTKHAIVRTAVAQREADVMRGVSGAVVTFYGVVRSDEQADRSVEALSYEAYPEMAEHQIERLIAEARARWSLDTVRLQHRIGEVAVGEISVVTIVAAAHRAEAYAASQFLIERIKHEVPIWKRERYDDGATQWSACAESIKVRYALLPQSLATGPAAAHPSQFSVAQRPQPPCSNSSPAGSQLRAEAVAAGLTKPTRPRHPSPPVDGMECCH